MLVLTRKPGETVCIGDNLEVYVIEVSRSRVKLGFNAPRALAIQRGEVADPKALASRVVEVAIPPALSPPDHDQSLQSGPLTSPVKHQVHRRS